MICQSLLFGMVVNRLFERWFGLLSVMFDEEKIDATDGYVMQCQFDLKVRFHRFLWKMG